jgi:hypothetical protein
MFSFLLIIGACFCNPSIKLVGSTACSDKGITDPSLGITCRTIRESCDSPREVAPKKVCNSGLRCVILKNDHSYRCATQDDIEDTGEEVDPEVIINGHYDEVKMAILAICIIFVLIGLTSMYVYKSYQRNQNNLQTGLVCRP